MKEYKKVGYDGMKMYEEHPNHRMLLGYPLYDEIFDPYKEIFNRLEKNPKLNFLLAHWGFLRWNS